MRLLLAPMEGLLDFPLRDVLTRVGGYDHAVTEFARVSGTVLPRRYFRRISPELASAGRTSAGTPVRVQLLGSDPALMAGSAGVLAALGPAGIDLNFGCPAPTVNRHRGGAVLLDEPELLHRIAGAVRAAVPRGMPFSAKMRLGVSETARAVECAQALVDGGVDELVVHARTKADGYRPPAHWEWVGRIADAVPVAVAANGEVWCEADWRRCRAVSGASDVMLGRGAVADPFLARRIRLGLTDEAAADPALREREWAELRPLLAHFWQLVRMRVAARHAPGRLKQWLGLLRRNYPAAQRLFDDVRVLRLPQEVDVVLARHGILAAPEALAA
ncbi:tRNA-dihydrouridine synthase [Thauera sp. CAU 1555]|uniref:tRNA-dihydrouridine(16) synthase n=1 Tax=Thauera sedimentorum TaxID=2767595 RepID=A0ABR9B8M9_9RHOO|nr:tRNA-dihydrouridine synthase [Thauera sedimentorum]MBC9071360.1 tRNA-dihydrouridine synthase [Thauera sedimentorum]MBD8502279.1 tRNA-dihydrouridine synthase [Thauera sedimentorum]